MASTSLSPAEKLQQRHGQNLGDHRASVQEIVDQEDIEHPPPSLQGMNGAHAPPLSNPGLSANALGKQKASRDDVPSHVNGSAKSHHILDPSSEESFPSLGGGSKVGASAQTQSTWGARKDSHGSKSEDINGSARTSGQQPTKAPSFPHQMSIPGKHSERIQFAPSQLLPRNQLKKPLQEIVRDINRRSRANIDMKTGPNGHVIFEGKGPVDATRQALKDLAKEVGSKQQVKIPLPSSVRPHIIGRQGAIIQGIQARTGAKVQLPKSTDDVSRASPDDDDSITIDVLIEGDAVAAELARREIEAIIAERTSTVNLRLRDIPSEFLPFLAGPYNAKIKDFEGGRPVQVQIPHYHTWTDRAPPSVQQGGVPLNFVPSSDNHIRISGDRLAVMEVRAQIEREVEFLRQQLTVSQVPIDRGRHQFVLSDENAMHEFLELTGCALVLPPNSSDTEVLTVTGPPDRIEAGVDRVVDLASAMQMSRIDIAKQHINAPIGAHLHAHALTNYLQYRKVIELLEAQHQARIVVPINEQGSADWEVYVKDGKNGIRAKQDILNYVAAYPPSRIRHVEMDPFFHAHVYQKCVQKLHTEYGTLLIAPKSGVPSQHLVLVYEGQDGSRKLTPLELRQSLTTQEAAESELKLKQSAQYLQQLIQGQEKLSTVPIVAPHKFHDKVRRFVERQQRDLSENQIPIQVRFGPSSKPATTKINGSNGLPSAHAGHLQGPSAQVDNLLAQVLEFLEAEERDEIERGHVLTMDFPQKHMSHLIGKRGETINKYREEFDVDVQTKEDKIDIIGPKAKAELAKAKFTALLRQWNDEATHVLKIHPKYHGEIIGPKGSQINKLQDRHNVRIQFPRTHDERNNRDDSSENSGPAKGRKSQVPDEVIIKGPSKGADAAREELLSFLQWTIDNSHLDTVSVAQKQIPQLIGQGGQELESLRLATGAQIDVPQRDSGDAHGRVKVQIKGTRNQVAEAKKIIEQKVMLFDSTITRTIEVDQKYHKSLIGAGGSSIRDIVVAAGGSDDRRDLARTVRFPKVDSGDRGIQVEGSKDVVDKICKAIEDFAIRRDGQITSHIEVAPEKHRIVIGRGGETRKKLESEYDVEINVPRISEEGPTRSQVRLVGQQANIDRLSAHILELVQDAAAETVEVPRKYHHQISNNGQFFRRLRNDLKVTVDHANTKVPARPAVAASSKGSAGPARPAATPLITDEDGVTSHSFQLVTHTPSPADSSTKPQVEEGTIPWILKGKPDDINAAKAILLKAIESVAQKQTQVNGSSTGDNLEPQATGFLFLPDPRTYRFIIGQGGKNINELRRMSGCQITVPKDQTPGLPIEIVGTKAGVESARDAILETVEGRLNGSASRD